MRTDGVRLDQIAVRSEDHRIAHPTRMAYTGSVAARGEILDSAWAQQDVLDADFESRPELLALRYVAFIQAACRQIENLLVFLPVGFVLTLISLNSYPFQRATCWAGS